MDAPVRQGEVLAPTSETRATHTITATAPGAKPRELIATVTGEGQTVSVSHPHCNGDRCNRAGHDYRASAFEKALVSDIAFTVGGAALIGGTVLWLTAPRERAKEQAPAAAVTPTVGPNLAAISVRRHW